MSFVPALPYPILEFNIESKTGRPEDCEDYIYIGNHFIAVIDGVTEKTPDPGSGTSGQSAARILTGAVDRLDYKATVDQAAAAFTSAIAAEYEKEGLSETVRDNPNRCKVAVLGIISMYRREVWLMGDCHGYIGDRYIGNPMKIDRELASKRAKCIEAAIANGTPFEQLRLKGADVGRKCIEAELTAQWKYRNNPDAGEYCYAAIDGIKVPPRAWIRVEKILDAATTIVLASDGYPYLKPDLRESEEAVRRLLEDDPLCYKLFKSTKGCTAGNISFDDRAFIKLRMSAGSGNKPN